MIVIDASLALDLALVRRGAESLLDRAEAAGQLAAPEVIDLEIMQALRRQVRVKSIELARANAALDLFQSLPIERYSHRPLASRIWALRDNLTAYDAAYFALSEALKAPLWTRDSKYLSVPLHSARVEVF